MVYVRALIFTERDSQKGIIVGKKGQILKKIGELARSDIENLLGSKVYLDLWVKVRKDWRNKDNSLKDPYSEPTGTSPVVMPINPQYMPLLFRKT